MSDMTDGNGQGKRDNSGLLEESASTYYLFEYWVGTYWTALYGEQNGRCDTAKQAQDMGLAAARWNTKWRVVKVSTTRKVESIEEGDAQ